MSWLEKLLTWLGGKPQKLPTWQPEWSEFLESKVGFYRALRKEEKAVFEHRILLFLQTTAIESGSFEVTVEDCLLVAASAVIPVWGFPKWHYFNLKTVYLFPASFNQRFECYQPDSMITGMVGTGPMAGKMGLSRPHLYLGFENTRDKRNVGIHEFVHLVDMADGECDGYPEKLKQYAYSIPWFELVAQKISDIDKRSSNIRDYGATNRAEFLAVASEYFFERPAMLQKKHPKLFDALSDFYQQDVLAIEKAIRPRKRKPCPCGSNKRYKNCCMPRD